MKFRREILRGVECFASLEAVSMGKPGTYLMRIATDIIIVLHAALSGKPIVVPAHRVKNVPA